MVRFCSICTCMQAQGYVARSAFKLLEIQQKHKLIPQGGQVLDLGCHPGAWLQVPPAAGCVGCCSPADVHALIPHTVKHNSTRHLCTMAGASTHIGLPCPGAGCMRGTGPGQEGRTGYWCGHPGERANGRRMPVGYSMLQHRCAGSWQLHQGCAVVARPRQESLGSAYSSGT